MITSSKLILGLYTFIPPHVVWKAPARRMVGNSPVHGEQLSQIRQTANRFCHTVDTNVLDG